MTMLALLTIRTSAHIVLKTEAGWEVQRPHLAHDLCVTRDMGSAQGTRRMEKGSLSHGLEERRGRAEVVENF
jgi:hypothetical protein